MTQNKNLAVLFCVERGFLEPQAKLLIRSYLNFSKNSSIQLFAFSPRPDHLPSLKTQKFLKQKNIIHICHPLNKNYYNYPIANKIVSSAFFEKHFQDFKSILFLDTDTVFLNPIQVKLININKTLFLRPVGHKGPGSLGSNDINDCFWKNLYLLYDIPLPRVSLKTSIHEHLIRPYYNAGFIWNNGIKGFYSQWLKDFKILINSKIRPNNYISRDKNNFRCLDQIALSITSSRYSSYVKILSNKYNYHIPFRPIMKNNLTSFDSIIHMHYHKWFQHPGFLDHITTEEEKKSEQYLWLKEHLPLLPEISGDFKC